MNKLSTEALLECAKQFTLKESKLDHNTLYGVTDGKAIGTYIESRFRDFVASKGYVFTHGNASKGLDFPDLQLDLKVTSVKQPQSSSPFNSFKEKVYGLNRNILLLVYDKTDALRSTKIKFIDCVYIAKERTADYQTTKTINQILENGGNENDLIAYFYDRNLPADDLAYIELANEIMNNPPELGYLTISNALQWRVQYKRVLDLVNTPTGIIKLTQAS